MTDFLTYFGEAGFEYRETGGGMTAIGRNVDNSDKYVLITDMNGIADNLHPREELIVGLHDDFDCIDSVTVSGFQNAIEAANRLIAKNVG